jgi:hypothetical protein
MARVADVDLMTPKYSPRSNRLASIGDTIAVATGSIEATCGASFQRRTIAKSRPVRMPAQAATISGEAMRKGSAAGPTKAPPISISTAKTSASATRKEPRARGSRALSYI